MSRYPTADDRQAASYDPKPNGYALALDPRCLYGWGPPEHGCHHRFGHACFRALGHRGRCMNDPHDDPCAQVQRPKNWDAYERAEANR